MSIFSRHKTLTDYVCSADSIVHFLLRSIWRISHFKLIQIFLRTNGLLRFNAQVNEQTLFSYFLELLQQNHSFYRLKAVLLLIRLDLFLCSKMKTAIILYICMYTKLHTTYHLNTFIFKTFF